MNRRNFQKLLTLLLIFELTIARTVKHQETITKPNGDKIIRTWTTNESDEVEFEPFRRTSPNVENPFRNLETFENDDDHDDLLKEAAQRKGMDPEAVEELLRTKVPVVRSRVDPSNGYKYTTTYKLNPSGDGISSRTVVEVPTILTTNRIITQVTQPDARWPTGGLQPNRRIWSTSWHPETKQLNPSDAEEPEESAVNSLKSYPIGIPDSNSVRVTQTWNPTEIKQYFSRSDSDSGMPFQFAGWPTFPMQPNSEPELNMGWDEPEFEPSTKNGADQNQSPSISSPSENSQSGETAKLPVKTLDELVANLYTTISPALKTLSSTPPPPPKTTTVKTIKLEDLPITEILNNGMPVDEEYLKNLPAHLIPVPRNSKNTPTTRFIKVENIPPTETLDDHKEPTTTPKATTPKTTTPKTTTPKGTSPKPTTTRTTTPKTTSTKPTTPKTTTPKSTSPPSKKTSTPLNKNRDKNDTNKGNPDDHDKAEPKHDLNAIADYLAKVGLTVDDLLSRSGRTVTKTIIDADGNILTATFMLSSVK